MEQYVIRKLVRSAGGVVISGDKVVVLFEPTVKEYVFPKGRLEPGEAAIDACLREVKEETGLACRAIRYLGHTSYSFVEDGLEIAKRVDYWHLEPSGSDLALSGALMNSDENLEPTWVSLVAAKRLLTHESSLHMLSKALEPSDYAMAA